MDCKNEKSIVTLGDEELSTVAGGSVKEILDSALAFTFPQTNVNTTTQVVAGNLIGGNVSLDSYVEQHNKSKI